MTTAFYLIAAVVYLGAAGCVLGLTWRLTRAARRWLRGLIRTAVIAVLFAPTIFACGGSAVIPFPLLLASDLMHPQFECNRSHFQVEWNVLHVIGPMWALLFATWMLGRLLQSAAPSSGRG